MESNEEHVKNLITEIKDFQITHGSLIKLNRLEDVSTVPARPVNASVTPTAWSQRAFERANLLQQPFNELYMKVAGDEGWLYDTLRPLVDHDHLFQTLWDCYTHIQKAGSVQDVVCGIFRSDYMLHHDDTIKQVEMNTMSIAGACHAQTIGRMHQHIETKLNQFNQSGSNNDSLPSNNNTSSLVAILSEAHNLYQPASQRRICILMVVQLKNFNIADERPIEYGLWDQQIPCYRCDWQEVLQKTQLTNDRTLLFRPSLSTAEFEVSVVYYRAGYEIHEYDEPGKETRTRLELSRAIKCPDLLTHLTTFKTVQQALTRPGVVRRFLDEDTAAQVCETFMPMQTLDSSPEGESARQLALDPGTAKHYVLKPNLEGGGHNIYREDIPTFLATVPRDEWANYVLMRLIEPPERQGLLMTFEGLYEGPVVSELGILGTCLWKRNGKGVEILSNKTAGWTFKTKPADVDEMSVVKGYGCFDCPRLTR